jgi:hypothetical protein
MMLIATKSTAICGVLRKYRAIGTTMAAVSAASEEYRNRKAIASQTTAKISATCQARPISTPR